MKSRLKLVTPTIEHKELALDYIQEHFDYGSNINGVGGLNRYLDDYEGWLQKLHEDRSRIVNEDRVPAETYFLVRSEDSKIIGMINIRLELNERLRNSSGHIGYGIRPTERRKGYNKINLYLALLECKKRGIKEVMLSCDKSNLGSAKSMIALSGKLTREYYSEADECMQQEHWIDVDESITTHKHQFKQYLDI